MKNILITTTINIVLWLFLFWTFCPNKQSQYPYEWDEVTYYSHTMNDTTYNDKYVFKMHEEYILINGYELEGRWKYNKFITHGNEFIIFKDYCIVVQNNIIVAIYE